MNTLIFLLVAAIALAAMALRLGIRPSRDFGSVDAIIPAYNEELCIEQSVRSLLANPYIFKVIVVNDGSTDRTATILDLLASQNSRITVVHQANTGKGGALMNGVAHSEAQYVFLTDADTYVPPHSKGIGYLIAELERGADAVGGIPASNLSGAGFLPHVRATVKLPMIAVKRTFQQVLGGAPFLISGACGLFRTEVLRQVPFSDRTKVEDLDLTWTLAARGYQVRLSPRCIVYSQECNSPKAEWLRWRRWIIGYAVCMRLHRKLLLTRFGIFSILPMFLAVCTGLIAYGASFAAHAQNNHLIFLPLAFFPLVWLGIVASIATISAWHHRRASLILLSPLAIIYVLLAYAIWLVHGLFGLVTGREPVRDKPRRYSNVVA